MTLDGGRPWLLSLGLHLLVVAVLLFTVSGQGPRPPSPVRMHWVSKGAAPPGPGEPRSLGPWTPPTPGTAVAVPGLPSWRGAVPSAPPVSAAATVPVALDELLTGVSSPSEDPFSGAEAPTSGWSNPGGEGYQPPPLPPPRLAPPQGARWSLVISVPGGGGPATAVDGLDSGHPDLDAWLEAYLRTVSFPAGLEGNDHQLRWNLELHSGRPR